MVIAAHATVPQRPIRRPIPRAAIAIVAAALLALAACAPTTRMPGASSDEIAGETRFQRRLALEEQILARARVHANAVPLLIAAADFCENDLRPVSGFLAASLSDFSDDARPIAAEDLGFGRLPRVIDVAPGSPAGLGGLLPGDVILAVDDSPLPFDADPGKTVPDASAALGRRLAAAGFSPLRLTVRRAAPADAPSAGEAPPDERDIAIAPVRGCDYQVVAVRDSSVNASTDGDRISINAGMLRFVENDAELQTVISHELAHNIRGHVDSKIVNASIGAAAGLVLDVLAIGVGVGTGGAFARLGGGVGAGAWSQSFEAEADYVGLYVLARAGGDLDGATSLWRRMGAANPGNIEHAGTHPTTARRFVAINRTIDEIRGRIAAGEPLVPRERVAFAAGDHPAQAEDR